MSFAHFMGFQNLESLYTDLGTGFLDIKKVVSEYEKYLHQNEGQQNRPTSLDEHQLEEQFLEAARNLNASKGALIIDGSHTDLRYSYAKCCNPIPGDDAIGFVSKTGEVKIHRTNCKNMQHLLKTAEERVVEVSWANNIGYNFLGAIKFVGEDRVGLINDVTETVSKFLKTNIQALNISSDSGMFEGVISLYVKDLDHLDKIIYRLSRVSGMKFVQRYE
jgi:GTP pyrophosphokinase/guanosine-3',5'-bis(diphosphate) 3'-pyrophosphohydrolase